MSLLKPEDLAALNADHRMLFSIMQEARDVVLPCEDVSSCHQGQCSHKDHCHHLVRETFHRVLFATIGHFGRQERLIRPHIPDGMFQRHAESHADISEAINKAITTYSKAGNALRAFAAIHDIQRMYEAHYLTLDAEVSARFVQPQSPATSGIGSSPFNSTTIPDLPLTGNPAVDRDHESLHAILKRSRSICLTLQSGCDQCSATQQRSCATAAIDLVTDALKFMVEHFRHEEKLLVELPPSAARDAHLHDHAEISRNLSQIVADYEDSNTALCIHRLSEVLHDWVKHHIVEHDIPLLKTTGLPVMPAEAALS